VNLVKLAKKKIVTKGTLLKLPSLGRCPECGSSLYVAKSFMGTYIVCSNPLCSYHKKVLKA